MIFEKFETGSLFFPDRTVCLGDIMWEEHPAFQGVALKHLLTSADSGGTFSYHLVRIAPGCEIGRHIHAAQLETHEVIAGSGACISRSLKPCKGSSNTGKRIFSACRKKFFTPSCLVPPYLTSPSSG